jgi:hypothetical protein
MLGQLVDIDPAIGEYPRLPVYPANTGVCGDNSFQALSSYGSRHNDGFPLCNEIDEKPPWTLKAERCAGRLKKCGKDVYNGTIRWLSRRGARKMSNW